MHAPLASTKSGFESIVAQQPGFVPAYIQLARIERLSGDDAAAKEWWRKAKEIVPSHNFVLSYRGEVVSRIRIEVTSTRITGPIREWLGKRVLLGKNFRFVAIVCLRVVSSFAQLTVFLQRQRQWFRQSAEIRDQGRNSGRRTE